MLTFHSSDHSLHLQYTNESYLLKSATTSKSSSWRFRKGVTADLLDNDGRLVFKRTISWKVEEQLH